MVTFNILVLIVVVFAPSARAILRVVDSALEPRGPAWTTSTFRYYGPQGGGAEATGKPLFLKPDALCDLSKSPDSVAGRIVVAEADGATGCSLHRTYRILNGAGAAAFLKWHTTRLWLGSSAFRHAEWDECVECDSRMVMVEVADVDRRFKAQVEAAQAEVCILNGAGAAAFLNWHATRLPLGSSAFRHEKWDECSECDSRMVMVEVADVDRRFKAQVEAAQAEVCPGKSQCSEVKLAITAPHDATFEDIFLGPFWLVVMRVLLPALAFWTSGSALAELCKSSSRPSFRSRVTCYAPHSPNVIICATEFPCFFLVGLALALGQYGPMVLPLVFHLALTTCFLYMSLFTSVLLFKFLKEEKRFLEQQLPRRLTPLWRVAAFFAAAATADMINLLAPNSPETSTHFWLPYMWIHFLIVTPAQVAIAFFYFGQAYRLRVALLFILVGGQALDGTPLNARPSQTALRIIGRLALGLALSGFFMLGTSVFWGLALLAQELSGARDASTESVQIMLFCFCRISMSYFQMEAIRAEFPRLKGWRGLFVRFLPKNWRRRDFRISGQPRGGGGGGHGSAGAPPDRGRRRGGVRESRIAASGNTRLFSLKAPRVKKKAQVAPRSVALDAIAEGSGRSSQTSSSVASLPSIASNSLPSIASNSGPSGGPSNSGPSDIGGGGGESTPARGGSRRPRKAELDVLRYGESPRRAEPAEGDQARDDSPEGDLIFRHFSAEVAAAAEASGRLGELGDLASPHGDGVEVESGGSE
eukprot:CAMPEP_0172645764 /NCGR_PEP_ID=MMETSP1068-20121228/239899_1 /TAXON_ID=35684 /ORGANISM="Pseudopedinella elastica, Strain CCMP716" /LENGTH=757 /DNA_ID=CAMNT_0013460011 /DNA_START=6 /DNA_END=2279 /DNA_ORIENTATION=+